MLLSRLNKDSVVNKNMSYSKRYEHKANSFNYANNCTFLISYQKVLPAELLREDEM